MADDAKLADAKKRVSRAERKALDRALALRDEAEQLLATARTQAARIREEAKAEAARLREEREQQQEQEQEQQQEQQQEQPTPPGEESAATTPDADEAYRRAVESLRADLETARAETNEARAERDQARGEIAAAQEETKAARAERDRARTLAGENTGQWAATATLQSELNDARERVTQLEATIAELLAATAPAAADDESEPVEEDDLLALVALVEAVEAERDALAAELAALKGDAGKSVTPPA